MLSYIFFKTKKQTLKFFLVALAICFLGVFLTHLNTAKACEQQEEIIVVDSNDGEGINNYCHNDCDNHDGDDHDCHNHDDENHDCDNHDDDNHCVPPPPPPPPPSPQCSDGIDNDGDGIADFNSDPHSSDPGCTCQQDDDEENEFPEMYLPQMPACSGNFGTVTNVSSSGTFKHGFNYDNTPEHWVIMSPGVMASGSNLDWYWVWISSSGHIEWDLGGLTNGVRVYPSQDHGPYPEEFDEYKVKVSSDGSNWFVVASSTTYVDDITNVRVHDGAKDYSTTTPFRYVRISPVSLGGGDYEIDAIQGCSVPPPPPPPPPPTPPPQCSDGLDNDGDGLVDMNDPGCSNSDDDDETNEVPPPPPPDNDENTPPVIALLGNNPMQLTVGDVFTDPGATSTDQEDGDLTNHITATSTVNTSIVGTYTVTYTVVDSKGAQTQATRTVIVSSGTPPSPPPPTPPSNNGGGGGGGGGNPSKPCKDALDNDHDGLVDSADPACHTDGNPNNPNSYSEYSDENSKPIISVIGNNPFEIFLGTAFIDPGATSTDQEDGNLTNRIATTSNVNISVVGNYIVAYRVSDSQGASAEGKRQVVVKPAASESPPVGPQQCNYLLEYLKLGANNNPVEVRKLQTFLRDYEGFSNLAITGIFDQATFEAVSKFQEKYDIYVLEPWDLDSSTGYVYITTKKKVNEIYCKKEFALTDEQKKEIESFRNLLGTIRQQAGTTTPESEIEKMLPEVGQTATSTFAAGISLPELRLTTEAEEKGLIGKAFNFAAIFFAAQGKNLLSAVILIFVALAAFAAGVLWQKIKIRPFSSQCLR